MIYLIIVISILTLSILGVFLYFHDKFKELESSGKKLEEPLSLINLEYPKSIVRPFQFYDLDDFEATIIDILNLVTGEGWSYKIGTKYDNHRLTIQRGDAALLLSYRFEVTGDNFKAEFTSFEFGTGYDPAYEWLRNRSIDFRASTIEKTHKNLTKSINQFIHQVEYNYMVDEREKTKSNILEQKSILDIILTPIRRDRRINDILKK